MRQKVRRLDPLGPIVRMHNYELKADDDASCYDDDNGGG